MEQTALEKGSGTPQYNRLSDKSFTLRPTAFLAIDSGDAHFVPECIIKIDAFHAFFDL
jgi:hypothetical protein